MKGKKQFQKLNQELKAKTTEGKWVYFHHKGKKNELYRGICVKEVFKRNIKIEYAPTLQKIIWCQDKTRIKGKRTKWRTRTKLDLKVSIRSGYYVIKSNRTGLAWGQYAMNTDQKTLFSLFQKAKENGFFKEMDPKEMKKELRIASKKGINAKFYTKKNIEKVLSQI